MSRYIDADKLQKDGWKLRRERYGLTTSTYETMELDCVPSADVVEVVRCKDCKHNYRRTTFNHGERDNPSCKYTNYVRDNDFYCRFGERAD